LVDVTEGVCIQTRSVLNQAFLENIEPILVFNKMDRLIIDLQMSTLDAYQHLQKILQEMNVVMSQLISTKIFKKEDESKEEEIKVIEQENNDDYFSPQKGNVCFCSSIHGWGFKIEDFANIYHEKLGMKKKALNTTLWGEFFFNSKTKTIKTKSSKKDEKPMFVQFILDNIWSVYQSLISENKKKIEKISQTLNLNTNFLTKEDSKFWIKSLMSQWLPLPNAILDVVCQTLPSPIIAQRNRVLNLIPDLSKESNKDSKKNSNLRIYRKKLRKNLLQCDKNGEILIFVSKMIEMDSIPEISSKLFDRKTYIKGKVQNEESKPEVKQEEIKLETVKQEVIIDQDDDSKNSNSNIYVAFSRIFSGTLKIGDKVKVLGARYNYTDPEKYCDEFEIKNLYILMGKSLQEVNTVYAGSIFGIGGIEEIIQKTATISQSNYAPIFTSMYFQTTPIVKFAIEAKSLMDTPKLVRGLKLLNQCDPSVEIYVQETGENVLLTAGEVHAERCIRDLNEKFCKIPIIVR
jgi:ribosome assembly protein 1